ncbi:MAG: Type II secretion system protein E [Candidatus Nomurabacteria bacterium GW2011_GWA1_46_11]|uniref:Type II secretion system protein E n=2 Tax=Parcubacteria group TaxID=1794811 RepID=A0A0G1QVC0_9BACT|nr:MAG: Type II secretion system protein E [Candidatus Nomurabacteria bacterium GW2011_GWA1_46_11]
MTQIPDNKLKEILLADGLVSEAVFNSAAEEASRLGNTVAETLVSRNIITDDYFRTVAARYLNVPLMELEESKIDINVLNLLPEEIAKQKRAVPFARGEDGSISVALEDPNNLVDLEFLERYLKGRIVPYLASENSLNIGFSLYGKTTVQNFKKVIEDNIRLSLRSKTKGDEAAEDVPIVAIVDNVISYALSLRASDIHTEVFKDYIIIRYRVDGVLHEILRIPKEVHPAIVARVKLLSELKIDEHSKPQDGRFRYQSAGVIVDIRVSVMPTFYGEKIVMRLLRSTARPLSFRELGMLDDTAKFLEDNIKKSYGMVLVTGPTGSGKTTTLYSVLSLLNKPEVNIVTIEDPIEYDINYVNQTQINPAAGITFAGGLRSFLRQDPNVMMVGEIRDAETAEIAVQAALTGHLVLSTLHTNDAPTAVPRLMDMNVPPFLVSAVLNAILAQRLVRKLHLECIESYAPDEGTISAIKAQLEELGLDPKEMAIPKRLYRGGGCAADGYTGYQGRIGIFEVLNVSDGLRGIINDPGFSLDKLRHMARSEGMITMFEDGLRKAGRGMTTIDEVLRVVRE